MELHSGEVRCACITDKGLTLTLTLTLTLILTLSLTKPCINDKGVFTGGADGVAKHYDTMTGHVQRSFIGHARPITAVRVDPTPFGTEGLHTAILNLES